MKYHILVSKLLHPFRPGVQIFLDSTVAKILWKYPKNCEIFCSSEGLSDFQLLWNNATLTQDSQNFYQTFDQQVVLTPLRKPSTMQKIEEASWKIAEAENNSHSSLRFFLNPNVTPKWLQIYNSNWWTTRQDTNSSIPTCVSSSKYHVKLDFCKESY